MRQLFRAAGSAVEPVVVLAPQLSPFERRQLQRSIKEFICERGGIRKGQLAPDNLPVDLPCSRLIERFTVAPDDPRRRVTRPTLDSREVAFVGTNPKAAAAHTA